MRSSKLTLYVSFLVIFFIFSLCWQARVYAFYIGGVSLKDEKEMGERFNTMLRSKLPFVEDPEVSSYVSDILGRLVRALPRQPFDFKSSVVLNNGLNAFAVPGGYVFVFSGMIMNLNSEDELAGVIAHELAHVTQRHVASRLERAQFLSLGALLAGIAGIALAGPAGAAIAIGASGASQSAMLNYSRLDESEADTLGLQYLVKAGYNPQGMVGGFKVLRQKSWLNGVSVPTYLSTHPAIGDRINSLSARIAALPAGKKTVKDNTRFDRVRTLLWARYGDAQAALQRFSSNNPLSLMGRGIVLARLNRIPDAEKAFTSALAAAPNDSLIQREAGIFHFRKGNMAGAEKLLASAVKNDRNDYMAQFYYARLLDETGRQKEAAQYYTQVLRQLPEHPDVHEAYGRSLGNAGNNFLAYVHLAYGSIYANNKKQAERYLNQARNFSKTSADRQPLNRLEKTYRERKEIWDKL